MKKTPTRFRRISEAVIDRVNTETDLVALIGERVRLKRSGKDFVGLCPFHDEKTPSFTVSPSKGFYHCFGCGAHGTAIDFVMESHGMGFRDAVTLLAERLGITITHDPESQKRWFSTCRLADFNRKRLAKFQAAFPGSPSESYLVHQRRISRDTLTAFQVGHDAENNRAVFPIHDQRGRIAGFVSRRIANDGSPKYRNSKESALFEKRRSIYGLYLLTKRHGKPEEIIVTEGCLDVLSLHSHGIDNAVAVLGTGFTLHHANVLFRMTNRIVLVFDADDAGQRAVHRAVSAIAPMIQDGRYVKILCLESGDPDEYVRQQGADAFRRQVAKAPLLSEWLQKDLRCLFPEHAEGQALYRKAVDAILAKMPPSHFKKMLSDRFQPVSDGNTVPPRKRKHIAYEHTDACDRLMALTLRHTALVMRVDERILSMLPELYGTRGKLAQRILERIREDHTISYLRERIRGHRLESVFKKWFHVWVPADSKSGQDILEELIDQIAIQYHRNQHRKAIEDLLRKDPLHLTDEERRKIDTYIRELRTFESGNNAKDAKTLGRTRSNRNNCLQL